MPPRPHLAAAPDLISLATPADEYNEKHNRYPFSPAPPQQRPSPSTRPAPAPRPLLPNHRHQLHATPCTRPPRALRITRALRPWLPMILYLLTSLIFVVGIACYRTELFEYLDRLSSWLRADEQYGQAILFFLIFLTTIPPVPLYSTLIVLSGYTFGPWVGAIISYFAALSGALVVFIVSRSLFREHIAKCLNSYTTIRRVVSAIEKRPKLLFLIRLAPYPYNVLNCLLAASPTLTLHTYTVCTALSLFKVIIHTSVGSSIHSFKDFHVTAAETTNEKSYADWAAHMATLGGIGLCFAILVYLSVVARRAVDEELDDELPQAQNAEETESFLNEEDVETGLAPTSSQQQRPQQRQSSRPMAEAPFSSNRLLLPLSSSYRTSFDLDADQRTGSGPQQRWS